MNATHLQTDCRFCSQVSKANGEDPIGSAWPYQQWLLVEIPQPWPSGFWQQNPQLQPIAQTAQTIEEQQGHWPRLLAIAPDQQYSQPNFIRILYLQRPQAFERHEFLVPQAEMSDVAIALLTQSEHLSQFEPYRQDTQHIRDLVISQHDLLLLAFEWVEHQPRSMLHKLQPVPLLMYTLQNCLGGQLLQLDGPRHDVNLHLIMHQ
ncbi:hypothetical protein IQ238_02360 [Pleurocapsales cyanobacterium LEGE 06147]|nr:hypothetical protein [Pleurocapsales cyanobacterium LEGE 06147]